MKRLTTFIEPMKELVDFENVLHPSFRQTGTITGRYSCSNPNAMNIPAEGDRLSGFTDAEVQDMLDWYGMSVESHIKRLFAVRPGYVHIHSDKKSIEIATMAHYVNDKHLCEDIEHGRDIHTELCQRLFGQVTKDLRRRAKSVLFGYMYGAGAARLAQSGGTSVEEAIETKKRLEALMPGLVRWRNRMQQEIITKGYIANNYGRRYYLDQRNSYKCVNYMSQGTAGQEVKSRMIALRREFDSRGWENDVNILLNIHDDIGVECPQEMFHEVAPVMHQIMEEVEMPYNVPLRASLEATTTCWADLKEIDPKNPQLPQPKEKTPLAMPSVSEMTERMEHTTEEAAYQELIDSME
jgi:DNA polymerase-1